jgi:hypothetical protein
VLAESREPYLAYLAALFTARVHEESGRLPQAAVYYRLALTIAPGAQSASLGLGHVLLMMGSPMAGAATIADAIRPPAPGERPAADPWWLYPRRQYWRAGEWIARMRRMVNP